MQNFIHWLESHMFSCFYKQLFGITCPGCGIQRSFIALLKGDFFESFKLYPALLFVLFTLGLTVAHLFLKFKNGALAIKYSFIFTTSIVIISYIVNLLK